MHLTCLIQLEFEAVFVWLEAQEWRKECDGQILLFGSFIHPSWKLAIYDSVELPIPQIGIF